MSREEIYAECKLEKHEIKRIVQEMKQETNIVMVILSALISCEGMADWLILSTQKERPTYERIEFTQLGIIPYGRTDFYAMRRKFYYTYKQLKEKQC